MRVEVAYATPREQFLLALEVHGRATVREAIEASGIRARCPEIDLAQQSVGIFGRAATLDDVLSANDRVEIYRPLTLDPKEARRVRRANRRTAPARGSAD